MKIYKLFLIFFCLSGCSFLGLDDESLLDGIWYQSYYTYNKEVLENYNQTNSIEFWTINKKNKLINIKKNVNNVVINTTYKYEINTRNKILYFLDTVNFNTNYHYYYLIKDFYNFEIYEDPIFKGITYKTFSRYLY